MNGCVILLINLLSITSPTGVADNEVDTTTQAYLKVGEIASMSQTQTDKWGSRTLNPNAMTRIRTADGTKYAVNMQANDIMRLPCVEMPKRQEATQR